MTSQKIVKLSLDTTAIFVINLVSWFLFTVEFVFGCLKGYLILTLIKSKLINKGRISYFHEQILGPGFVSKSYGFERLWDPYGQNGQKWSRNCWQTGEEQNTLIDWCCSGFCGVNDTAETVSAESIHRGNGFCDDNDTVSSLNGENPAKIFHG
jgi:hypothetical protein